MQRVGQDEPYCPARRGCGLEATGNDALPFGGGTSGGRGANDAVVVAESRLWRLVLAWSGSADVDAANRDMGAGAGLQEQRPPPRPAKSDGRPERSTRVSLKMVAQGPDL